LLEEGYSLGTLDVKNLRRDRVLSNKIPFETKELLESFASFWRNSQPESMKMLSGRPNFQLHDATAQRLSVFVVAIAVLSSFFTSCTSNSHPNGITSLALSPATSTIAAGQTQQFTGTATTNNGQTETATGAEWSSSNTAVATVDANGRATAVAQGSTTISASVVTSGGTVTGTATLNVTPAALVSIAVSPQNPSISTVQTQQFTATGTYTDNSQQTIASATWTSSNTAAATINGSGLATAVAAGSTTITAAASGVSGSTLLSVTTVLPTNNTYQGTQSPGDLWTLTVDDIADTFSATDESTGFNYAGSFTVLPNGFDETTINSSTDPNRPAGTNGYAMEVPGVALVMSLGGSTDAPIAAIVAGPCPIIDGTLSADLVHLGKSTYDSTQSESYAVVSTTQSGSNYNFTLDSYLLDGTLRSGSGAIPNPGTCSDGVITIPGVPDQDDPGSSTVTAIAAPGGLYVLDLGIDSDSGDGKGSAVGTTTEIDPTQVSTAMTLNYLGFLFKRNSTPMTTFVGFGPGSGTSITGGSYANQDTDPFSAHATNITISLPGTNSNGFLQGTVTDSNGTHTPFVAVITNSGGKYFLFGITTDVSTTTPYAIVLAQQ